MYLIRYNYSESCCRTVSLLLHQPVSHNQLDPLSRFSMRFPPAVYAAVYAAGAQRKSERLAFWRSPKTCSSHREDCGRARAGQL